MNQNELHKKKLDYYLEATTKQKCLIYFCCLLGAVTFFTGILLGENSRVWGSFLFNLMFFFSISFGGVAFGGMQDVISALWARPIKRLHESFSAFMPTAVICFIVFFLCIRFQLLGAHEVYSWIKDPHFLHSFPGKNVWLQRDFMLIRDTASLFIMLWLVKWHMNQTLKRDHLLIDGHKKEAEEEAKRSVEKLRYWSAPILCVHSICFSLICFDLTMSLAPTWFSTLWGGWSFSVLMQALFAVILVFMFLLKKTKVGKLFGTAQFHDIGKLLYGFTVFFAYLTFAHVLTYWYTNIPEETSYFITRLQKPWIYLIIAAPVLSFIIPFFMLIPRASKLTFAVAFPVSLVVILAQWINYLLVVMPEVTNPETWNLPWLEVGGFIGFLGLFTFNFSTFAKKNPMVSLSDPLLLESFKQSH